MRIGSIARRVAIWVFADSNGSTHVNCISSADDGAARVDVGCVNVPEPADLRYAVGKRPTIAAYVSWYFGTEPKMSICIRYDCLAIPALTTCAESAKRWYVAYAQPEPKRLSAAC